MNGRCEIGTNLEIDENFIEEARFLGNQKTKKAVSFGNDHMFEFYVGRRPGSRAASIGGEPDWKEE